MFIQNRERIELVLFVASSHLLLVCFLLHTSFIGDGGYVGCLDQLLPPATASYNLQDEQLRLLRIKFCRTPKLRIGASLRAR